MIKLTKRALREALNLDNDAALARWFEISHSAVSQWPEDQAIPRGRMLEVALRRPDLVPAAVEPAGHAAPRQGTA